MVVSTSNSSSLVFADENAPKISALMVKQRHEYYGDIRVFIIHDAIKVNFENKGTLVIARGPAWNVVEYSPQTKVAFQSKFKDWMAGGMRMNMTGDPIKRAYVKEGENLIGDERAAKYIRNDKRSRSRYWIDEHIDCSPQAAMIVERLYRLPVIETGFPLELSSSTNWEKDKNSIVWLPARMKKAAHPQFYCTLVTNDIKKIVVPKTEFDYPTHCRLAKNEQEVWLTPPTRSAMKMIIRALEPADAKNPTASSVHH
jgi:hypothetical protein